MTALDLAISNLRSLVAMLRDDPGSLDQIDDAIVVSNGPHGQIRMKTLLSNLIQQPDRIIDRRANMVERLRQQLQAYHGTFDRDRIARVLMVMSSLPREEFVDSRIADYVYLPYALTIGQQQTISQPYMVAIMVLVAEIDRADAVLDIGTGSGYQAAVLSQLAARVISIEVREALSHSAQATFARLGLDVETRVGDGFLGSPDDGPFDAIIAAASVERVSAALLAQLKVGGRIVIPVGKEPADEQLFVYTKRSDHLYERRSLGPCYFVRAAGYPAPALSDAIEIINMTDNIIIAQPGGDD